MFSRSLRRLALLLAPALFLTAAALSAAHGPVDHVRVNDADRVTARRTVRVGRA